MTTTTTQADITRAVTMAANQDLRIARTRGIVTICQTKLGNLTLERTGRGAYRLSQDAGGFGSDYHDPRTLAEGKAGTIRPILMAAYYVDVEN